MIPEFFKEDTNLNIRVFGFEVSVAYIYHWPGKRPDGKEPTVVHLEFRSESRIISQTGYRSHFLSSDYLKQCSHQSIA